MPNRMVEGTTAAVSVTLHGDGQRRRQSRIGGAMHLDTPATENVKQHATKLTKRHLMKPFWVLTVPFLFPSTLAAEPSLAETIQYIEAKLNARPSNLTHTLRLNGQIVTYSHRHEEGSTATYTFELGDMSTTVGTKLEMTDTWRVNVSCARGLCVSFRRNTRNINKMRGGVTFHVSTHDAERVQKALVHAIKLSGGKDELF